MEEHKIKLKERITDNACNELYSSVSKRIGDQLARREKPSGK